MSDNEILFRITEFDNGEEIFLDNMSIEVADKFQDFLKLFTDLAKLYQTNNDIKVNVYKGSAAFALKSNKSKIELINDDFVAICEDRLDNPDSARCLRKIQDEIKNVPYKMELAIIIDNNVKPYLSHFRRDKRFKVPVQARLRRISSIEFIKGELEEIGGKSINFHVLLPETTTRIIVSCKDKSEAKRIGHYIFSNVFVVVQKNETSKIVRNFLDVYNSQQEFEYFMNWYEDIQSLEGIERYDKIYSTFEAILEDATKEWEIKLKRIRKHIRLFDSKHTEPGMLRTILIVLKPFKDNLILSEYYTVFLDRLKSVKR